VSLRPSLLRRKIVTLSCREYFQPFDLSKHFRVFISLECRFSLLQMRWFVGSGLMSLEAPDDVQRHVAIGCSTGPF
jgi:hypothetical protein